MKKLRIQPGAAVAGIETVDLLFNIIKLGVAETEHVGIGQQSFSLCTVAVNKVTLGAWTVSVAQGDLAKTAATLNPVSYFHDSTNRPNRIGRR